MTALIVVLAAALAAVGAFAASRVRATRARRLAPPPGRAGRILFPFTADTLSRRTLEAALRLARAEDATLLPVFLATVPHHLPLDSPLPRQAGIALEALEAVETRAVAFAVLVDGRIERGRTPRHALRAAIAEGRYDRIVVAAAAPGSPGFAPADIAWMLTSVPGEIVVLRPGEADPLLDEDPDPALRLGERATVAVPGAY